MIHYRTFRNFDPPGLVDIWRSQSEGKRLLGPIELDDLERLVLAKPYFDPAGLTLALDDDKPVGFSHAGFGPSDDEQSLCTRYGSTCLIMVRPEYRGRGIGAELLSRGEAYLRSRGAQVLYAGSMRPLNPFYLGLYGGSEAPGVLDSEPGAQRLFARQDYREVDRCLVYERPLAGFRPPVDRMQVQVRRQYVLDVKYDPQPRTWWEACTAGPLDCMQLKLLPRGSDQFAARAVFWALRPAASGRPPHEVGLLDLETAETQRRKGLATFLLGESFRQLAEQGIATIYVQTMQRNEPARKLYEKLGFRCIDQGVTYRKEGE